MERYNDIRGLPYPFNLASIRSFSSPSPITMSTSCPLGIAFAVRPSAGGVQLHLAVLVLYEAFRPQHMAACGVGEEGRDILFELLAREAQLQKVGRTKGPMRLALPASNYSKRRFFFYRFNATALFFHKHSLWFSIRRKLLEKKILQQLCL